MKKEKPNRVFIVIIVILALLPIATGGYLLYDKLNQDKDVKEKQTPQSQDKEENKLTELAPDDKIVETALAGFAGFDITAASLYGGDAYDVSSISKLDLIATAFKLSGAIYPQCGDPIPSEPTVSVEELNAKLTSVLLNPTLFTLEDIKAVARSQASAIDDYTVKDVTVAIKGDRLQLLGFCGNTGPILQYTAKKVVKAEKDDNYVYIYQKEAFAKYNFDTSNYDQEPAIENYDYYKEYNFQTKIQSLQNPFENSGNVESKTGGELTWNSYNTYKYTFKIVNNQYYFQSLERVK